MSQAGGGIPTSGTIVYTLTGDNGVPVSPSGHNINIFGDGLTIQTVGDNTAHSITISALPMLINYTNVATTPYVVTNEYYMSVNTTIAPITIVLPDSPTSYTMYVIKDRTGQANINNILITTVTGLVLIDNVAVYTMNTALQSVNIVFNSVNYEIW